jgi:hypothetical protein
MGVDVGLLGCNDRHMHLRVLTSGSDERIAYKTTRSHNPQDHNLHETWILPSSTAHFELCTLPTFCTIFFFKL